MEAQMGQVSREQDPLSEPAYLQKDVTMTDDEKIINYDELKEKYSQMVKKLENFEQKCSYMAKQVTTMEKMKCKTKKKKTNSEKKFSGQNTTSEQFESIENDDSIPQGWKSSWRIMDGFSKGKRVKVYWAPNGKFCGSRVSALNYMVTELNSSEDDIEEMKKSLVNEGWTGHESLPGGWLHNDDLNKCSKRFVTSDFHYLKNIKLAVKHLSLHFSEAELGKFVTAFALKKSEILSSDLDWLHDEAIPYPWKAAQIRKGKGSSKGLIVISSNGQVLSSFKIVHEFISNTGEMSHEELEKFSAFISKVKNRGKLSKITENNIKADTVLLERAVKTEKLDIKVEKIERAIKTEKNVVVNDGYKTGETQKKSRVSTLVWNDEDETIPKGWKSAVSQDGQIVIGQKFRDSTGRLFQGRLDALRTMIKTNEVYSHEDVKTVKKGLLNDGWFSRDSLPEGWMMKKIKMSDVKLSQRFVYLTPTFELLDTFEKVFAFMKENHFSEEKIAHFKSNNGLNWHSDEDLPSGWTFAIVTTERQGRLKRFMDPQGKFWNSSSQAIKNCFDDDSHGEVVKQFRKYLINKDGWFVTEYLPEGWILRQKRSEKGFYFMNTRYEKFNTTKAMYKHLKEENKYGEQAVRMFENNYKKLQVPIADIKVKMEHIYPREQEDLDTTMSNEDDSMEIDINENEEEIAVSLDWSEKDSLPVGWMVSEMQISEGKLAGTVLKRYMSPCENYFGNLPEAIKFLENDANASDADLELMKKGLASDGWVESNYLPFDWLIKQEQGKEDNFLSPSFDIYTNQEEVLEYLKNNDYTEQEIDKFTVGSGRIKWSNDESVPDGWKVRLVDGAKRFLSPSGSVFNNRPLAIKHMLNCDSFSNDGITQMQLGLTDDGWIYDENLPPGWLKQRCGDTWNFLTSKYELLESIAEVLKHLLLNNCSSDMINKFKYTLGQTEQESVLTSPINHSKFSSPQEKGGKINNQSNMLALLSGITITKTQDLIVKNSELSLANPEVEISSSSSKLEWNTDESLPEGWMQAVNNAKGSIFTRFRAPNQKYFASRLQAMQYMVSSDLFKEEEIIKMKKSFEKDGFTFNTNLPSGWMSKVTNNNKFYLTHTNEKLSSNESVINFMKEHGYNNVEVEKFFEKSSANWNCDDSLPEGWKLAEVSHASDSSKKWFKYMSPEGKVLSSRPQAIRYMMTLGTYKEEDIDKMKSGIQEDGWTVSPNLPTGWYQKKRDQYHMLYLTPNFETLKSIKNVISYMKMKNYESDVIRNFKPNVQCIDSFVETPKKRKLENNSSSSPKLKSPKTSPDEEQASNDDMLNSFRAPRPFSVNQKDKNLKDWIDGDDSLPEGWKKRFNEDLNTFHFMSTHGHVFNNRAEAFRYMIEHPDTYTKLDIDEMVTRLVHEDWHTNPLLPVGWRIKKLETDVLTLTEAGSMYKVVKSARAKIKKHFSEVELKKFSTLMDSLQPTNREYLNNTTKPSPPNRPEPTTAEEELKDPLDVSSTKPSPSKNTEARSLLKVVHIKKERVSDIDEQSNHVQDSVQVKQEPKGQDVETEMLPRGWKMENNEYSEEVIQNADGKMFESRRDAVEFMIKNSYTPKSIYNLWNSLDQEGWILKSDLVPAGWRVKFHPGLYDYKYLTRDMKIIHSTEEASLLIKASKECDQEKFEKWASEVSKSCPKIVWKTDAALPSEWLISSGLQSEIIKDQKGSLFEGRKEAIDYMIKEHCSPTNIFKLWNTLHIEGWISDEENLPTGWKRKFFSDKNRHNYLSPMMEVVKSTSTLLYIVKDGKEYTEEEIKRVENWMLNERNSN